MELNMRVTHDYGPMAYGNPVLAYAQLVRGTKQYKNNIDHMADAIVHAL